jgi:hypothetical protein
LLRVKKRKKKKKKKMNIRKKKFCFGKEMKLEKNFVSEEKEKNGE